MDFKWEGVTRVRFHRLDARRKQQKVKPFFVNFEKCFDIRNYQVCEIGP